uniref:Protein JASON n=1 Tax=Fagus sylvatica TaxID=28930 RepID=A0A2N9FU50_FAGSY
MGCFFGCFRIKDDRHHARPHLVSDSTTRSKPTEVVISQNRLSSLFLTEEKEDSPRTDREALSFGSPENHKGLKDEARFLKACGTLAETPTEIRKASKLNFSPSYDRDPEPQKFHSWLPNTSIKKLQLDNQPDQPHTPIKLCEEWGKGSGLQEQTPSSSTEGSGTGSVNTAVRVHANQTETIATSVSPWVSATEIQCRNKSVRFECDFDGSSSRSSSENVSQNRNKSELLGDQSVSKPSPYPTPRELRESLELPETATPGSEGGVKESESGKDLKVEASLSAWLKPQPSIQDENSKNFDTVRKPPFGRTPGDRPIIGLVAAHWNDNEPSHISPKWWDGNGIPNSTNKYKEDQKVSWHATPFEERLEKALSEESVITQRKNIDGKPIAFDENEESDTALSQLQSSNHPKSVVSF